MNTTIKIVDAANGAIENIKAVDDVLVKIAGIACVFQKLVDIVLNTGVITNASICNIIFVCIGRSGNHVQIGSIDNCAKNVTKGNFTHTGEVGGKTVQTVLNADDNNGCIGVECIDSLHAGIEVDAETNQSIGKGLHNVVHLEKCAVLRSNFCNKGTNICQALHIRFCIFGIELDNFAFKVGSSNLAQRIRSEVVDTQIEGNQVSFCNSSLIAFAELLQRQTSLCKPFVVSLISFLFRKEAPFAECIAVEIIIQQDAEIFRTHGAHSQLVQIGGQARAGERRVQRIANQNWVAARGLHLITSYIGLSLDSPVKSSCRIDLFNRGIFALCGNVTAQTIAIGLRRTERNVLNDIVIINVLNGRCKRRAAQAEHKAQHEQQ